VFIDVDSIPIGADFRTYLADAVGGCDVLLVVIGDRWAVGDRGGQARLHDPDDYVRIEIETALVRSIPVVPVLVGKAPIPRESELPVSLRPLVHRNACSIDQGLDFHAQVDRLIRRLEQLGKREMADGAAVTPAAQETSTARGPAEIHSAVEIASGPAQGTTYELSNDRVLVGRSPDCEIVLSSPLVSRYHAQFVRTPAGYSFEDLGTANGSYVNGGRVAGRMPLNHGDRIHVGQTILLYRRLEKSEVSKAEQPER
jgi:hypothetical protein